MNQESSLSVIRKLRPVDFIIIMFGTFLSLFSVWHSGRISAWFFLLVVNIAVMASIIALAKAAARTEKKSVKIVFDWYPALLVFFSFKEMHVIIQSMGREDFDGALIAIDRSMFGIDPTVWISRFASPFLTEILQIAYASFYVIMIVLALELYIRREEKNYNFVLLTIIYGFFLSYLGYLTFPAVGPRFTIHDFAATNAELPGLWLSNGIRDIINAGESIPKGAVNPIMLAQRDAFPSGHTQMTLIVMILAARFSVRSRYLLYILGTLLIIGTVYLRYHYVIDLIAGAGFAVVTLWTAPRIKRWWEKEEMKAGKPSLPAADGDSPRK